MVRVVYSFGTGKLMPSAAALQAMYSQHTDQVPIILAMVDSGDNPGNPPFPLRFASNGEEIVSNGETFNAGVFGFIPSDEDASQEKRLRIVIPGPPTAFIVQMRLAIQPPTLVIQLILASDPDTIQRQWSANLRRVTADATAFIAELDFDRFTAVPFPADRYSVGKFPGLFS